MRFEEESLLRTEETNQIRGERVLVLFRLHQFVEIGESVFATGVERFQMNSLPVPGCDLAGGEDAHRHVHRDRTRVEEI